MTAKCTPLSCRCGQVKLSVSGTPILSAECLCADCQKAGSILQALPRASAILDKNGGTRFEIFRKDRVQCEQGAEHLREHRLSDDSKTRRVVAVCCNTPMFLDFTNGHWLSIYGALWQQEALPPLEIRTMTRSRPPGVELPDDVPNPSTHTVSFYFKLLSAWVAMGFRTPKVDYVNGRLDVP